MKTYTMTVRVKTDDRDLAALFMAETADNAVALFGEDFTWYEGGRGIPITLLRAFSKVASWMTTPRAAYHQRQTTCA